MRKFPFALLLVLFQTLPSAYGQDEKGSADGLEKSLAVGADDLSGGESETLLLPLRLSQTSAVEIAVPHGWAANAKVLMPGKAASLEMLSMNGLHKVKVNFMVPPDRNPADFTDEELQAMARIVNPQWVADSVEGQLNLQRIETDAATGFHGSLTDKTLVGKPVPPGQWRHLTTGASKHEGFLVGLMIYSNQHEDPHYAQALATWQALRGLKNPPPLHELVFPLPSGEKSVTMSIPAADEVTVFHRLDHSNEVMVTREGFNLTLLNSISDVPEVASPRWCQEAYVSGLLASIEGNQDVSVDLESIQVEDRGALVRYSHDVLGKITRRKSVRMPNVFFFTGRPNLCSSVHVSVLPADDAGRALLQQVDESVSVGEGPS